MEIKHIVGKDVDDNLLQELYEIEKQSRYESYDLDDFREIVTYPTNDTFYCFDNNEIIGHATFNSLTKKYPDSIYCINLGVDIRHHKCGIFKTILIAKSILIDAYKYYSKNGIKYISAEVDRDNYVTLQLCMKLGFKEVDNLSDEESCFIIIEKDELSKLDQNICQIKDS